MTLERDPLVLGEPITEVPPRPLVPTPREAAGDDRFPAERESGEAPARAAAADPTPPEPVAEAAASPAPRRERFSLRRLLRQMDPREITAAGPAMPLVVMGLFSLVTQWDDAALGLLLPEIRREFGTDLAFILTLTGMLAVLQQVLAPWIGYLADRHSRVRMLQIGAVTANAASLATGFTTGIGSFTAARAGINVGAAVLEPAGFPLLSDYYPSRVRARTFAILSAIGYLGQVAGPILGGNLGAMFGWRVAVISLGSAALGVSLLSLLLREPVRGYQDRIEAGASEEAATREQAPVSWGEGWRAARSITTIRRLWWAAPFLGVIGWGGLSVMGFYYSDEFGVGPQGRGYINSFSWVAATVGLLAAGPIADRILRINPGRIMSAMAAGLLLQGAVFATLAVSPVLWLSVALNVVLQVVGAIFLPVLPTLLSLTVPARIRGLGLQTVRPFYAFSALMIPPIAALGNTWGTRGILLALGPLCLIPAVVVGSAAYGVARDIRAARASALAEEESRRAREAGRSKLLVCRDVDVSYDGVQVLFGVDLDVEQGEIVALLGTNGAGKSTLLRAIAGVQEASNGAITFDGRDITHLPPHEIAATGAVMVPGGRAIFPSLTVAENLRAAAWLSRDDRATVEARTEEVLAAFPALRARLQEHAGNMSGGEQQMLALGQAFLMRPTLLMIDELSLGLAPAIVEQLLDILRAIHAGGTTVILVEQSINVAMTIAERAVFMEKGEVRFVGRTEDLLHRGDVMRSVFLGSARTGAGLTSAAGRGGRARAPEKTELLLRADDIRVAFGGVAALQGASIDVHAREIVGVIGPNGAGKTTLFDAISGRIEIDEGRIELEGADVTRLAPDQRARLGLGRSFQSARLFPTMTARESIAAAMERHLGMESALGAAAWLPPVRQAERRVAKRADTLIDLLGLQAYADKFVGELSTATRRIVDMACVMASEPRVLLLDEPSSGLAQAEAEELGPLLERLVRETGCGLLIVEHDIPLVTSISDRLVAMDLGRVLTEGDPDEVVAHPEVVRAYLGTSEDVVARSGRAADREGA